MRNSKSGDRELHVQIEPIVSEPVRGHDLPSVPSYARYESVQHFKVQLFSLNTAVLSSIVILHFGDYYSLETCDYLELILQMSPEDALKSVFRTSTNLLLIFVSAATVIFIVFAIVLARQRPRRRGFIEVFFDIFAYFHLEIV